MPRLSIPPQGTKHFRDHFQEKFRVSYKTYLSLSGRDFSFEYADRSLKNFSHVANLENLHDSEVDKLQVFCVVIKSLLGATGSPVHGDG